jgi:hypothetical protein
MFCKKNTGHTQTSNCGQIQKTNCHGLQLDKDDCNEIDNTQKYTRIYQ